MSVIIVGSLYLDENYTKRLPTPIGPFEDREAGYAYIKSLNTPLWGSWNYETLHAPEPHNAPPENSVA